MEIISLIVFSLFLVTSAEEPEYIGLEKLQFQGDLMASNFSKDYYVSTLFIATWENAKTICNKYGLQFATLETETEADYFTKLCGQKNNYDLFFAGEFGGSYSSIGGKQAIPGNTSTFHWIETDKPIDFKLNWAPGEPNNHGGTQHCLAVQKILRQFQFDDVSCDTGRRQFVCEKLKESIETRKESILSEPTNVNENLPAQCNRSTWIYYFAAFLAILSTALTAFLIHIQFPYLFIKRHRLLVEHTS